MTYGNPVVVKLGDRRRSEKEGGREYDGSTFSSYERYATTLMNLREFPALLN
jgi:hypothetical protein